ncbi:MAG: tRNA (adenosine(37)-N6)-threonylcarbamoyltransferase complex ATPase subunit type 1 TsaE [Legionellales bacterium]
MHLINEAASDRFAAQLATQLMGNCLSSSLIVTFSGEIGTGKTTIIRAMLKSMGVQSSIKSPTFTLVESYLCHNRPIHHFDLYRIQYADELDYLGFRDYFSEHSICCIEWPEHAGSALPHVDLHFQLGIKGAGREMHAVASSVTGERILACLAGDS